MNKPLLFLLGFFLMIDLQAQTSYTPCETYSSESHELISTLRSMLDDEYESILRMTPSKQHERIREMYNARTRFLVNQVKSKWFVKNDSLERYVNTVFAQLTGSNSLGAHRKIVLIARSHEVNAVCYGRGVFVVTVGLLGRIRHEAELAFTLAHEIAHDELDHVPTNVLQLAEIHSALTFSREQDSMSRMPCQCFQFFRPRKNPNMTLVPRFLCPFMQKRFRFRNTFSKTS